MLRVNPSALVGIPLVKSESLAFRVIKISRNQKVLELINDCDDARVAAVLKLIQSTGKSLTTHSSRLAIVQGGKSFI